jgi:hypothetical protein
MSCAGSTPVTELQFATVLRDGDRDLFDCCGPTLTLPFTAITVAVLEDAFNSPVAHDLLWSGYCPQYLDEIVFTLCVGHWMVLACLAGTRGRVYQRHDWVGAATALLTRICVSAGWDIKELVNMLSWQRTHPA